MKRQLPCDCHHVRRLLPRLLWYTWLPQGKLRMTNEQPEHAAVWRNFCFCFYSLCTQRKFYVIQISRTWQGIVRHVQDFHSAIEGALSDEEYVHELHEAMLEECASELAAGEERAAQRALRKAELKVRCMMGRSGRGAVVV